MKTYGNFTRSAVKAVKTADRLVCQTVSDGPIYVANSYMIFAMTAEDYDAIVRPVVCCDPGNWSIRSGIREGSTMDLEKIFRDAVSDASGAPVLSPFPATFPLGKSCDATCYYSADADFVAVYNASFIAAAPGVVRARGSLSAAVVYCGNQPTAMILPIKPAGKDLARAVKAYFVEESPEKPGRGAGEWYQLAKDMERERDTAEAEVLEAQQKATDLEAALEAALKAAAAEKERADRLAQELEDARQACQEAPATGEPEQPDTAAAIAAATARFAAFPGVTATVKGAQTTAPVVWLSGDTSKHADAITAAGARWSHKRGAYYYRVA